MSTTRDNNLNSYRLNLRGAVARRVVDSANYYNILKLVLERIYHANNAFNGKTIRFFDLVGGHFYQILDGETVERVLSVKKTDEGYIINPDDVMPSGDDALLQENEFFLNQEDDSNILV